MGIDHDRLFKELIQMYFSEFIQLFLTKLRGEDLILIIHIEAQSYYQKDFSERMFYSSRLFEKYRCCILPIAVFSYDGRPEEEPDGFSWGISLFTVMEYQFYTVELRKKNWRHFIKQDNPIAAALLSKMKYTKEEKVQVKKNVFA